MLNHLYFNLCPVFETFCAWAAPPPPPPPQPHQPVPMDAVDRRDLDDFGIDPDGPDPGHPDHDLRPDGVDMGIVWASLMKSLPLFDAAEELDELLKQLPMPSPGPTGGISVREAVQVDRILIIWCYIVCYITCDLLTAGAFAGAGPRSPQPFHCQRASFARFCKREKLECFIC